MSEPSFSTEELWTLPRVGTPSASRDGRVVVVAVSQHDGEAMRTRVWRLGDDADVAPRALTSATESASSPAVSPDGRHVAFVRKVDGMPQAHVLPMAGGEPRPVTSFPLGLVGSLRWAGDDRLLVVSRVLVDDPSLEAVAAWHAAADDRPNVHATERRTNRAWDTWYDDTLTEHMFLIGLDGDVPVDLTPGEWLTPDPLSDPATAADLSPDGSLVAFATAEPDGDEDGVAVVRLFVAPVSGGGPVRCLMPDDVGGCGSPRFLPDGTIAVTIRRDRDFYAAPQDLWAIDPADGSRTRLLDDIDHGLDTIAVGPDGTLVVGTELAGRGRLLRRSGSTLEPLPAPATGGLSSPVITEAGILCVHASVTEPPEVVELRDGQILRRSAFTTPALDGRDLGRLEERWIAGADGAEVQVFLLHPPAAARSGDGPPPLLHLIHGGPHGTFGDTWHWRWAAARFAAAGHLVAMVNFHGSTSFGHEFTRSIHGDWATKPVADVLAATDALVADGTVDEQRMAIAGGSYGGYLTVMLSTRTNRFKAAVAHAAVTDFGGMWATDWPNGFGGSFGGRLWEDPAATYAASPHMGYGAMATPMLVTHGDQDLRVPIDQGRALFGVLQEMRIPSRLVIFPEENHWVLARDTNERWYAEVLGWLDRWV